jgi:hypothetical protein
MLPITPIFRLAFRGLSFREAPRFVVASFYAKNRFPLFRTML